MRLIEFIMPLFDNNGNPVTSTHTLFKRRLTQEFGGFTSYEVQGQWFEADTQKTYNDVSACYRLAIDEEQGDALADLIFDFGKALKQKSVFVAEIGTAEVLPYPDESEADDAKS